MRTVAYTALHYGKPYLESTIRSVIDAVDSYVVVYTPYPSHGHTTTMQCPDSRDDLLEIASAAAGSKLIWYEHPSPFRNEAEHRNTIFGLVPNADVILVVDSDEVWSDNQLEFLLSKARDTDARDYLAYGIHFYRSFYKAIINDMAAPVRAIKPSGSGVRSTGACFAHFGYAVPPQYVKYKISCWGHYDELRRGWYEDIFLRNISEDCHPTNERGFWNAVTVNPWEFLPDFMRNHPYAEMELIT